MLDQPGTGEALRLQELTARIDAEAWAGAVVDCLLTRERRRPRPDRHRGLVAGRLLRPTRRGVREAVRPLRCLGRQSRLGRSAAPPLEREGERPVPHYWEHVLWVWGHDQPAGVHRVRRGRQSRRHRREITVPFLIAHGANDRQIPLEYAHRSYDQAVNSPKRELRVFTPEEGATEHIGLDHLPYVSSFIADWVADTFSQLP